MLSIHLRVGLARGLFHSDFPTNNLFPFFISPFMLHAFFHILVGLIILIIPGEEYKLRGSAFCSFLRPTVTSALTGPNILSTLFSNTLCL
jgi:hypothetical protein